MNTAVGESAFFAQEGGRSDSRNGYDDADDDVALRVRELQSRKI